MTPQQLSDCLRLRLLKEDLTRMYTERGQMNWTYFDLLEFVDIAFVMGYQYRKEMDILAQFRENQHGN